VELLAFSIECWLIDFGAVGPDIVAIVELALLPREGSGPVWRSLPVVEVEDFLRGC